MVSWWFGLVVCQSWFLILVHWDLPVVQWWIPSSSSKWLLLAVKRKQKKNWNLPASFPAPQEVARLTQQLTGAQTVQEEQEKAKAVELQEQLSSKQHNGWNEADPNNIPFKSSSPLHLKKKYVSSLDARWMCDISCLPCQTMNLISFIELSYVAIHWWLPWITPINFSAMSH